MTTRAAGEHDVAAVLALFRAYDALEFASEEVDAAHVRVLLGAGTTTRLVLDGERVVGFAAVQENGECESVVDPSAPGSADLHTALAGWLVEQGRRTGAALLEHWAGAGEGRTAAALQPHGFRPVRSSWVLVRTLVDLPPADWPPGVEVVPADVERDGEVVWDVVQRSFAGLEFTHPRPYDAWAERVWGVGMSALLVRRGDEVLATATRGLHGDEGYVGQLGVLPDHRGQGLARALLLTCFANDLADGRRETWLDVDGANAHARRLYDSVGMTVVEEFRRWDLVL